MKTNETFASIDDNNLANVSGGAARVAASSRNSDNESLTLMLTKIGEAIKDVGSQDDSMSSMMPMMMMMMMGGGGSSSAAAAQPAAAPQPQGTYVKVNVK